jgi:hypothetical protein
MSSTGDDCLLAQGSIDGCEVGAVDEGCDPSQPSTPVLLLPFESAGEGGSPATSEAGCATVGDDPGAAPWSACREVSFVAAEATGADVLRDAKALMPEPFDHLPADLTAQASVRAIVAKLVDEVVEAVVARSTAAASRDGSFEVISTRPAGRRDDENGLEETECDFQAVTPTRVPYLSHHAHMPSAIQIPTTPTTPLTPKLFFRLPLSDNEHLEAHETVEHTDGVITDVHASAATPSTPEPFKSTSGQAELVYASDDDDDFECSLTTQPCTRGTAEQSATLETLQNEHELGFVDKMGLLVDQLALGMAELDASCSRTGLRSARDPLAILAARTTPPLFMRPRQPISLHTRRAGGRHRDHELEHHRRGHVPRSSWGGAPPTSTLSRARCACAAVRAARHPPSLTRSYGASVFHATAGVLRKELRAAEVALEDQRSRLDVFCAAFQGLMPAMPMTMPNSPLGFAKTAQSKTDTRIIVAVSQTIVLALAAALGRVLMTAEAA